MDTVLTILGALNAVLLVVTVWSIDGRIKALREIVLTHHKHTEDVLNANGAEIVTLQNEVEALKVLPKPERKQIQPVVAPRWSESRDELEGKPPRGHSKPKAEAPKN